MKTRLLNYLRFNRSERNGTIALFLLAVLFFLVPEITRHVRQQPKTDFEPFQQDVQQFRTNLPAAGSGSSPMFRFNPNTVSEEELVRLGLSEKVARIICNYRSKGGKFRTAADLKKIWSLEAADYERLLPFIEFPETHQAPDLENKENSIAACFNFDPNTAGENELKRLGLPDRTVKSILNYRDKGGKFRKKEDLEKIYTLQEDDYTRIAPYATFAQAQEVLPDPALRPVAYAGGAKYAAKNPAGPVDVNRAGLENWRSLPGIGEMRARQLVNYREKLGGFYTLDQIAEMFGFPDSIFQAIKPHLVLSDAELRKINLNTASVNDLDAHPYISKRQAELIVAYREQHGPFVAVEDIAKMRAISDPVWLAKLRPYLAVN